MEGDELTENERQIFDVLSVLKEQKSLYGLEEAEREEFRRLVTRMLENLDQFLHALPHDFALLIQIYNILNETNRRLRFSQLFPNAFIDVLLPYNLAFLYQKSNDPQNALLNLTLAVVELEAMVRSNASALALRLLLGQFYLQTTALYSQLKQHSRALRLASQALGQVVDSVRMLPQTYGDATLPHVTSQLVEHAERIVSASANLEKTVGRAPFNAFKFLNWTHNPENQHKYLPSAPNDHKKLHAEWLECYAIADMMLLSMLTIDAGTKIPDVETTLIRLVNLIAVACFALATEKRILGTQEVQSGLGEEIPTTKNKSTRVGEMRRNFDLRQNQNYLESEFYYTQSIEVLYAFLHKSLIMNSLIVGYNTHYAPSINYITEEEELSYTASRIEKKNFMGLSSLSGIEIHKDEEAVSVGPEGLFVAKRLVLDDEESTSGGRGRGKGGESRVEVAPSLQVRGDFQQLVRKCSSSADKRKKMLRACSMTEHTNGRSREGVTFLPSPHLQKTMVRSPTLKQLVVQGVASAQQNFTQKTKKMQSIISPALTEKFAPKKAKCKCCLIYRQGKPNEECFLNKISRVTRFKLPGHTEETARTERPRTEVVPMKVLVNAPSHARLRKTRLEETFAPVTETHQPNFPRKRTHARSQSLSGVLNGFSKRNFGGHLKF